MATMIKRCLRGINNFIQLAELNQPVGFISVLILTPFMILGLFAMWYLFIPLMQPWWLMLWLMLKWTPAVAFLTWLGGSK